MRPLRLGYMSLIPYSIDLIDVRWNNGLNCPFIPSPSIRKSISLIRSRSALKMRVTDFNPDNDIPDLSGKTILITGGALGAPFMAEAQD